MATQRIVKKDCTDHEFNRMRDQHVPYELRMLRVAADALNAEEHASEGSPSGFQRFLAIEAFYIHLRNLHAFFFVDRKRPKDAVAGDFFDTAEVWRKVCPGCSREMAQAVDLAHKLVAHLSYERQTIQESGKGLRWLLLVREMEDIFQAFRQALDGKPNALPIPRDFQIVPEVLSMTALKYGPETTVSTPGVIDASFFRVAKETSRE